MFNNPKIWDNERLIAAFSRRPQNMSLNYGPVQDSIKNRKEFLDKFGVDYRDLVCAKQVHGSHVECVGEKDKGRGALTYEDAIVDTDAFITDSRNVPLAIFTADCLSIFLHDFSIPAIGIVHAGWRSIYKGIVIKTINLMIEKFNIHTSQLQIGFGPSIKECCYEVGREFNPLWEISGFQPGDERGFLQDGRQPRPSGRGGSIDYFAQALIERDQHYYLDLAGIVKKQLLGFGVKQEYIFDSQICTFCRSGDFFSYRRQGASSGRMMSVIMLN